LPTCTLNICIAGHEIIASHYASQSSDDVMHACVSSALVVSNLIVCGLAQLQQLLAEPVYTLSFSAAACINIGIEFHKVKAQKGEVGIAVFVECAPGCVRFSACVCLCVDVRLKSGALIFTAGPKTRQTLLRNDRGLKHAQLGVSEFFSTSARNAISSFIHARDQSVCVLSVT
jgi:hypothetical protein